MSHVTVMCIANDTEAVMSGLIGELWDYVDFENETHQTIDGVGINEFCTIGDLRKAFKENPEAVFQQIGAIVEHGEYRGLDTMEQLKEVLDAYDNDTWMKLYDVHQ